MILPLCEASFDLKKLVIRDIKFLCTCKRPIIQTLEGVCPQLTDIDITGCCNSSTKLILGDVPFLNSPSTHYGITFHGDLQDNEALKKFLNPSELRKPDVIVNVSEIRKVVENGVPADCSLDGWSLLDTACVANDRELLAWSIEKKEEKNTVTVSGKRACIQHALNTAAKYNRHSVAQILLENMAKVNAKDKDGRTALLSAVENNSCETVRILVEHNADVNAKDNDRWTALHWAAYNNRYDTAQVLIDQNADVNAKDTNDRTPLHGAAENNSLDTARVLLKHNEDVNAKDNDGRTALLLAAKNKNNEIARVENNTDVNAKGNDRRTALHWAAFRNSYDTARLLVEHNADVNAKDTCQTALYWVLRITTMKQYDCCWSKMQM